MYWWCYYLCSRGVRWEYWLLSHLHCYDAVCNVVKIWESYLLQKDGKITPQILVCISENGSFLLRDIHVYLTTCNFIPCTMLMRFALWCITYRSVSMGHSKVWLVTKNIVNLLTTTAPTLLFPNLLSLHVHLLRDIFPLWVHALSWLVSYHILIDSLHSLINHT